MELKHHEGVLSRRDSFVIDPRLLKIEPGYNVRQLDSPDTRAHIEGLKESISPNGVRVPLEVRLKNDDIYIVAGHCRYIAVMELIAEGRDDIKGVLCIAEPKNTNDGERTLNLAISNSGKPLTTLEIAEVVKRLEGFGWTPEDIRRRMQWKSRATVTQHEEVAALSEGTKQHIKNGEISASLARGIAKGVDPEFAEKLIRENLEENRRIRGSGKRNVKVTKSTLKRDAKPKPQVLDTSPYTDPIAPHSSAGVGPFDMGYYVEPPAPPIAASAPPEHLPPAPQLVMPAEEPRLYFEATPGELVGIGKAMRGGKEINQLLEALEPFARIGQDFDLNEKLDDDLCEVRFEHIKNAWLAFAKVAGGENV